MPLLLLAGLTHNGESTTAKEQHLSRMTTAIAHLTSACAATLLLALGGCTCGFDCSSDDDNEPAVLSLGFSDALPEELAEVVIELDSITLRGSGVDDVEINNFTVDSLNLVDAPTVPINLLEYRGANQVLVIEALELAAGEYSSVEIALVDGDVNSSYVLTGSGEQQPLVAAGSVLRLGGIRVPSGNSTFTVEFELARALQARAEEYRLDTEGIRIVNNALSARLRGTVDTALFDGVAPCDAKAEPLAGNRLYLYRGSQVDGENLADVFRAGGNAPEGALAPYAVAAVLPPAGLDTEWRYEFGFLPPDDYTLAFSCDAADDDPLDWDDLQIPLPADQVYPVNLSSGETATCNLRDGATCP